MKESLPYLLSMMDELGGPLPTTTIRSAGRTRWTRRCNGPSRSPRTSAARATAWSSRGRPASSDKGGVRSQFCHVIDIVPTILRGRRDHAARRDQRREAEADRGHQPGLHVRQRQGPDAAHRRNTSSWSATAAIYKDGWMASTTPLRLPWVTTGRTPVPTISSGSCTTSTRTSARRNNLAAQESRQAEGTAGRLRRRGEEVQRLSARLLVRRALRPRHPSEPDARADGVHLLSRE